MITEHRRQYLREYQARWVRNRRLTWLKEHGPCVQCGSWDDLELDHKDPTQKVTHNVWSWSQERRDQELAKCQVLCEECHKQKTLMQLIRSAPPGMSWCAGCRAFLDVSEFTSRAPRWNGLDWYCKKCRSGENHWRVKRDSREWGANSTGRVADS